MAITRSRYHQSDAVLSGGKVRAAAAPTAILAGAAACWVIAITQMRGMDMGVATRLGSFALFTASWLSMMAAMMLPGAIPAVLRVTRARRQILAAPAFVASYIAIWALVGIAVYALYRPHGTGVAGAIVVAAGIYELTPLKRHFRLQCGDNARSGFVFGLNCVGSSIALMAMLLVLGIMSVTWMSVIAVVVTAQKLLRPTPAIDVPLSLAIIGLGVVILAMPSSVPGLIPTSGGMPNM